MRTQSGRYIRLLTALTAVSFGGWGLSGCAVDPTFAAHDLGDTNLLTQADARNLDVFAQLQWEQQACLEGTFPTGVRGAIKAELVDRALAAKLKQVTDTQRRPPVPGAYIQPLTEVAVQATEDGQGAQIVPLRVIVIVVPGQDYVAELEALRGQDVTLLRVDGLSQADTALAAARAQSPDVIVMVGGWGIPALELDTAANLEQKYLVLGGQLAEPTCNVTAAVWAGQEEREVLQTVAQAQALDPQVVDRALAVGLGAIRAGYSGYVIKADH